MAKHSRDDPEASPVKTHRERSPLFDAVLSFNEVDFFGRVSRGERDQDMMNGNGVMYSRRQIHMLLFPYDYTVRFEKYIAALVDIPASAQAALAKYYESSLPPFLKVSVMPASIVAAIASIGHADARALYAAIYQGSGTMEGTEEDPKLVRLRYLTGAHGLREIRVRVVAYLADREAVPFLRDVKQVQADPEAAIAAYVAQR